MHRLYWLNAEGVWELVCETALHGEVIVRGAMHLGPECPVGDVGYAKQGRAWMGDYYWLRFTKKANGISRRDPVTPDQLPKTIQLLEMLQ